MTPELEKLLETKKKEFYNLIESDSTVDSDCWDFISQSLTEAHNNAVKQAIKVIKGELTTEFIMDKLKALEIK